MERSRARQKVAILDCCYSGAFVSGFTTKGQHFVTPDEQVNSRGTFVLTTSSALEYAFEDGQPRALGEERPSLFTGAIMEGLRTGTADHDGDGQVTVEELYDYVCARPGPTR